MTEPTLVAVEHVATYRVRPEQLAGMLNIKMPSGAVVEIEHVSDRSGRTTKIPPGHELIFRVVWIEEEET